MCSSQVSGLAIPERSKTGDAARVPSEIAGGGQLIREANSGLRPSGRFVGSDPVFQLRENLRRRVHWRFSID